MEGMTYADWVSESSDADMNDEDDDADITMGMFLMYVCYGIITLALYNHSQYPELHEICGKHCIFRSVFLGTQLLLKTIIVVSTIA